MARYYDIDKLKEMVETKADTLIEGKEAFLYVAKWLDLLPAADVVPKSEYDEVLSNWQKIHDSYNSDCIEHYKYGRAEVAREIFEEIESVLSYSVYPQIRADGTIKTIRSKDLTVRFEDYETIKKKYTEEK